jgi:biofilm PGA synthesis N-glycosyltransferase PgaC
LFSYPPSKEEAVSIVVPCYNAEKRIGSVIESLLKLDYPSNLLEIIVVDDKSTDNSAEVIREYAKKYSNVRLIINKRNSGRAAEPTNIGVRAAKYNYIAVADDDSEPEHDALKKMIGFLQRGDRVGAVTCAVLVKTPKNFIQRLQYIEYKVIAFTRKLLDCVDSVYVTPGPFALYKKDVLLEVGLFDTKNMTQDIEIVWRLLSYNYHARMCLATKVHSEAPRKLRAWFKQRIRWDIGGIQTLLKYKHLVFRRGMLGTFIIPFFSLSLFLGVFGFGLFLYLIGRRFITSYIFAHYSFYAHSSLLYLQDLSFSLSVLNFFGGALFILGTAFTLFSLRMMKDSKNTRIFNVMFYIIIYLAFYPLVLIAALYKMARGNYTW